MNPTHCPDCHCPLDPGEACTICATFARMSNRQFARDEARRGHAARAELSAPRERDDTRTPKTTAA